LKLLHGSLNIFPDENLNVSIVLGVEQFTWTLSMLICLNLRRRGLSWKPEG